MYMSKIKRIIKFFFCQGKKVTWKKAEARQGKIYVGKLPPGEALSKEDIQTHFATFGEVSTIIFIDFYSVNRSASECYEKCDPDYGKLFHYLLSKENIQSHFAIF